MTSIRVPPRDKPLSPAEASDYFRRRQDMAFEQRCKSQIQKMNTAISNHYEPGTVLVVTGPKILTAADCQFIIREFVAQGWYCEAIPPQSSSWKFRLWPADQTPVQP